MSNALENAEYLNSVDVKAAVGDGVADDTAEIQAVLNSGRERVVLSPDKTYLVSFVGTVSVNATNYRYCLLVPAGTTLDLNGATLRLANAQNASIVAAAGVTGAAVVNGTLDSNRDNQTTPATGEMAGVLAYNCDRFRAENLVAIENRQYAGRFLNCRDSKFDNLLCTDSYGDGWGLGTTGAVEFRLIDCVIDKIHAEDCEGVYAGLEGNGIVLTAVNTRVGSLFAKDCAGGTKIQNSTTGTSIAVSEFDGDDHTYGSVNSGTKIQGFAAGSLFPTDTRIDSVISRNCYGNGLVINAVTSASVGSYHGTNNGSGTGATGSDQNDVEINTTDGSGLKHAYIGSATIDNPDAQGLRHQGSGNFEFDSITIRNATGAAMQDTSSGRLNGRRVFIYDDQGGSATTTYAFRCTGSAKGRIDSVETNLTHSTSQSRVGLAAAQYHFEIGQIRLGSTDVLHPVVQLTNASATTALTNGHIWRDYVGGASDYLHPIIRVQPWDASARALSGQFGIVVTDGSSGTGGTLQHPTAGANDFVQVTVGPWKVVSQAQA